MKVLGFEPGAMVSPHLPVLRKVEDRICKLIETTEDEALKARYCEELAVLNEALRVIEAEKDREPPARPGAGGWGLAWCCPSSWCPGWWGRHGGRTECWSRNGASSSRGQSRPWRWTAGSRWKTGAGRRPRRSTGKSNPWTPARCGPGTDFAASWKARRKSGARSWASCWDQPGRPSRSAPGTRPRPAARRCWRWNPATRRWSSLSRRSRRAGSMTGS